MNLRNFLLATTIFAAPAALTAQEADTNSENDVFFGNLHVHTAYSFDGITNGAIATPEDAYNWARGATIPGGAEGVEFTIKQPLDWYAVSDHAEYLGVFPKMFDPDSPLSRLDIAERVTSDDPNVSFAAYAEVLQGISAGEADPELANPEVVTSIWQEVVGIADDHYKPGEFTTFPAFEWTSNPGERNLHRVVIFRDSDHLPDLPYSALDSDREEDLWAWMDAQRDAGSTLLAVPHNGNASDGLMFPVAESFGGSEIDAEYAETRMRNEPVYEIVQIKGASETHPALSPNDEYAGFELWDYTLAPDAPPPEHKQGGYMREALVRGLQLESEGMGNPFKYGFIGDSDTHNAATSYEEDNYTGKLGFMRTPEVRLHGLENMSETETRQLNEMGTAGLAAVWAPQNTREAIFDAIMRKETYATSGTRLRVRFFGGYSFGDDAMEGNDWIQAAYDEGVPMGGDLSVSDGDAPTFLISAMKDANGANLDRIQMIKGWVEDGELQEQIFDVACAGRELITATCDGDIGNTVDVADAIYTNDIGGDQLSAVWTDPDFDPAQPAVYYARILEIPTPRWSTFDAKALGEDPLDGVPTSIQERAWTSPIWYTPNG